MKSIILLALLGCATQKVVENVSTVNLNSPKKEEIIIEKNNFDPISSVFENEKEKEAKISLTLYSSIYHSLASIELIKELEKKEVTFSLVSSQDFGALIVALYAKSKSISHVEWSLFKLLKNLSREKPYSKNWINIVNTFIDSEFKNLEMKDLSPKLVIVEYDDEKSIQMQTEGVVSTLLKRSIDIENKKNYLAQPLIYHHRMERLGGDLNLGISFIPNNPSFDKINGYTYGVITHHLGVVLNEKDDITLFRTEKNLSLDKISPISDIIHLYKKEIESFVEVIIERKKNWQDDSSSRFEY